MSDATSGSTRKSPNSTRGTAAAAAATDPADLRTDMVTKADFAACQQQLKQEVADAMQQLRLEVTGKINSRVDMLSSINTALENIAAKPVDSKPYRISDHIPRSWEGNNENGEFRSFMSDLLLWMQAWSKQGEMILTSVETVDKFDSSAIAVDCPEAEFRMIDASLYQVLHRTTANEPLRTVQQTRGQTGFEAWRAIVRKYDQRNMSDKHSVCVQH